MMMVETISIAFIDSLRGIGAGIYRLGAYVYFYVYYVYKVTLHSEIDSV